MTGCSVGGPGGSLLRHVGDGSAAEELVDGGLREVRSLGGQDAAAKGLYIPGLLLQYLCRSYRQPFHSWPIPTRRQ